LINQRKLDSGVWGSRALPNGRARGMPVVAEAQLTTCTGYMKTERSRDDRNSPLLPCLGAPSLKVAPPSVRRDCVDSYHLNVGDSRTRGGQASLGRFNINRLSTCPGVEISHGNAAIVPRKAC